LYVTDMVRISVIGLGGISPVIQDDVSGLWGNGAIFNPDSLALENLDMLFASAFRPDQVNCPGLNCRSTHAGVAPLVIILHLITSSQRLMTVIEVDNLLIFSVELIISKP